MTFTPKFKNNFRMSGGQNIFWQTKSTPAVINIFSLNIQEGAVALEKGRTSKVLQKQAKISKKKQLIQILAFYLLLQ